MAKDIKKKTRGSWWYGWVRYTVFYCGKEYDRYRTTDLEYATSAMAQRAAETIAGYLTNPTPVYKGAGRFQKSKNDSSLKSSVTIIEVGASRAK